MTSLSVVTPTEGRSDLLDSMLASLSIARAHYDGRCEVLIVDSSEGAEAARISTACAAHGATYLRGPESVRHKRNIGIAASGGDIVIFIDSDETVGEDFLTLHAAAYLDPGVGGVVGPVEFVGPKSFAWSIASHSRYLHPFSLALRSDSPPWGPCANISYRRISVDSVGGFETNWPFKLGADDVDLSLRVRHDGNRLASAPLAVAYHSNATWLPLRKTASRGFRWGRMHVYLSERHKPTVQEFPAGLAGIFLAVVGTVALSLSPSIGLPLVLGGAGLAIASASQHSGVWGCLAVPLDAVFDVGALYEAVKTGRGVHAGLRRVAYSSGQQQWRRMAQRRQMTYLLAGFIVGAILALIIWAAGTR